MARRVDSPTALVGVDVGGTKTAAMVVSGDGRVRGRAVFPTDVTGPANTLAGIVEAIRQALADAQLRLGHVAAVGLGIPGRVDPQTGIVRQAVNLGWREAPAGEWLVEVLGVPCMLENDVRAAALGVQRYYGSAAIRHLAYVSIGTGISAGLILQGRLYTGAHGMAGEIGHVVVEPHGRRCACGSQGCLETVAAGPAIARLGREAVEAGRETSLRRVRPLGAESIYRAAAEGDAVALEIADCVGRYLGQALQGLVMAYDVERVILGGGVSRSGEAFLQPVRRELERQRQASALAREMLGADLIGRLPPDCEAGLWGAIALAERGRRHE
jgi:glucokinase